MKTCKSIAIASSIALAGALAGCGGSSSSSSPSAGDITASYDVVISNLTNAQPLSPIAVVAHDGDFRVFTIGLPATAGLELLAEGGDNSDFITEADADSNVFASVSGSAPIPPAGTDTLTISATTANISNINLSLVTMLVNTNDGFSGINQLAVGQLNVGESLEVRGVVYDAGTESNSEMAGTIPGPADGGEGFNALRDDRADQVTMHTGVVSADDGLAESILTQQHRFDNSAVSIRVTRTN